MSPSRRMSIGETAVYITLWAMLFAAFPLVDRSVVRVSLLFFLPGALLAGPIGLFVWGRQAFIPAALIGTILWIFLFLLLPAIQTAR